MTYVGRRVPRKEDHHLITGRGRYVGDIHLPRMIEAAVLRSPIAHGNIIHLDTSPARGLEGVVSVATAGDLRGKVGPITRTFYKTIPEHVARETNLVVRPYRAQLLAEQKVFRVGEPVAVVLAENRYVAEDALELIEVEYEPLEALTDPFTAMREDAPQLHPDVPGNIHCSFHTGAGDIARAFDEAEHTLSTRITVGRSIGSPLETRGVVAEFDRSTNQLVIWATQQKPHLLRSYLSEMLGMPEEHIRVISPDMGGSFGGGIYNEEIFIPFFATQTGRPIRWIEDRRENLANARHTRDQYHDVEVAFNGEGRIRGLKDRFLVDAGAYNPFVITLSYNTAAHLRNEFKIDNFDVEGICVLTNKRDNTPVRGAGRTSATFVIDRIVDMVAAYVKEDPADVRRKNLIPGELMPYDMGMLYRDGGRIVYDSGDYPAQLEKALALAGYAGFRDRQERARAEGRLIGIGISAHVEGSGFGPHEGATVRIDQTGHVIVHSGSNPHGQSHETVLAQVCADALGVTPEQVTVRAGDTGLIAHGGGTFASRSAVTAGSAVHGAATKVRGKVLTIASWLLEVSRDDLTIEEGLVGVRGVPGISLSFGEIAEAASPGPANRLPSGMDPGLEETDYYVPPTVTYSSGTHIAIVEVDPETGMVSVLEYYVVDDCGQILNPTVV
ncbi:MAG TPA: xanthine dehydrogenase family protein molybdopterin-binding subunit, partial [Acidimicrobiia bacterium]|nr:xanthine dehydrogenase family protein molybdopterin-binding subunit [Acidimicrobiia bacterium]